LLKKNVIPHEVCSFNDDAFAVRCQRCDFADVSKADEAKLTLQCFTDAMYDVDWSDADGELYNILVSVLQESHSALIQIAQTDLSACCVDPC